ncbi:hypothetical protein BDR05DRAFT_951433 [Suillus weaverae]|nr:hypothetical protein BDR05DRAFT_951433 [Suillus weaverae]
MDMKFSFADVCAAGGFTVADFSHWSQKLIERYPEPYTGNNGRKQAYWAEIKHPESRPSTQTLCTSQIGHAVPPASYRLVFQLYLWPMSFPSSSVLRPIFRAVLSGISSLSCGFEEFAVDHGIEPEASLWAFDALVVNDFPTLVIYSTFVPQGQSWLRVFYVKISCTRGSTFDSLNGILTDLFMCGTRSVKSLIK